MSLNLPKLSTESQSLPPTLSKEAQKSSSIWESFADNPYLGAGAGLMILGGSGALLRKCTIALGDYMKRRMIVSMEVPSKDQAFPWVLQWISMQQASPVKSTQKNIYSRFIRQHHYELETKLKQLECGDTKYEAEFQLVPGQGKHFITYRNCIIQVERERSSRLVDLSTGSPWESVVLRTLYRDKDIFNEILAQARLLASHKEHGRTTMYIPWGTEWKPFGHPRARRSVESVILDKGIKERIIADIQSFLKSKNWYSKLGIPYRRGYLFFGPPGSGKSSLINALAGEFEYNICSLNLSDRSMTDDKLHHLIANMPIRSFLLIEDVDACFINRKPLQNANNELSGYKATNVTFSGLLNAMDGVMSTEERITFLTTNHIEQLDPALLRPGRVDLKELIDNASDYQKRELFLRFYEGQKEAADEFVKQMRSIHHLPISTASLQGLFVMHKDDPVGAINAIPDLLNLTKQNNSS